MGPQISKHIKRKFPDNICDDYVMYTYRKIIQSRCIIRFSGLCFNGSFYLYYLYVSKRKMARIKQTVRLNEETRMIPLQWWISVAGGFVISLFCMAAYGTGFVDSMMILLVSSILLNQSHILKELNDASRSEGVDE